MHKRLYVLHLFTLLLFNSGFIFSLNTTLSSEMELFIENNPVVTIGGGASFEPFLILNEDGSVGGYDADILSLVSQNTGLQFEFEIGPWDEIQNRAAKGELDGLSSIMYPLTEQRERLYFSSESYGTFSSVVFVRKDEKEILNTPESLGDKRIALQSGNLGFKREFESMGIESEIIYTKDIYGMIKAVVSGEADYTILDETAYYVASLIGLGGLIEASFFTGEPFQLCFALNNREPLLTEIINIGLNQITTQEKYSIRKKWFSTDQADFGSSEADTYTREEKRFLTQNKSFSVDVPHTSLPFFSMDNSGQPRGIIADYVSLLETKTGLELRMTYDYEAAEISIIPMVKSKQTPEFDEFYPLFSFPIIVVTSESQLFIENLENYKDRIFVVLENSPFFQDMHLEDYNVITAATLKEAFDMVRKQDAFGFIGTSAQVSYELQKDHRPDLNISGVISDIRLEFILSVDKNQAVLNSIMGKGISGITEDEVNGINKKWAIFNFEEKVNFRLIITIVSIFFLIIATILAWNRSLAVSRMRLKKANDELKYLYEQMEDLAIKDQLTGLYNRNKVNTELDQALSIHSRYNTEFSVIIIDIDHFKKVNDRFGHNAGDRILKEMASVLNKTVRETDILGRWGGEEFLICCPQTGKDSLWVLGERLRRAVEEHSFSFAESITVSLGGALVKNNDDKVKLINRADTALYRSKRNGRNRFELEEQV